MLELIAAIGLLLSPIAMMVILYISPSLTPGVRALRSERRRSGGRGRPGS